MNTTNSLHGRSTSSANIGVSANGASVVDIIWMWVWKMSKIWSMTIQVCFVLLRPQLLIENKKFMHTCWILLISIDDSNFDLLHW